MSGKKYTIPNYQQLYRQQLEANWALEQRNQENARKIQEQSIIAGQVAQSEARMRQEVARIQQQVSAAERQAGAERVRLQELQQQALQDIAGVQVNLRVTQGQVQNMQWENQELHRLARQERQQIQERIEQARRENQQWHQIAQQERQQIQGQVQRNGELIERNRQEIEKNRQALQEGLEQVKQEMASQREVQRLEQMRNAAALMEAALERRSSIPLEWMERFDPENYRQAQGLLSEAQNQFERGNYEAALLIASQGLRAMSEVAGRVQERQKEYQQAREAAFATYDQLAQTIALLDTEEMVLWYGRQFQALGQQVRTLDKMVQSDSYTPLSQQQCQALEQQSRQYLAEAQRLHDELDAARRQHFERREHTKSFVKALAAQGNYRPLRPVFENQADPHSDILLQTEEGLAMRLALDGRVVTEFPSENNVEDNIRWMDRFRELCQKQGFVSDLTYRQVE